MTNSNRMTLGSLFDGIGGFPYSAVRHRITPVWASEIESIPISITKRHFPNIKHLGDICQINGAEIEPVDIITFGSPCQDLSVAGKRAGLDGARSGLFGEAIRIVNEMRKNTRGKYPKFAVWENVPGALSSNKGNDFRTVLEAFTKTEIPIPFSGRWAGAGMVRGGRCDIAWRILDAQYWGVPQRRRRIFLVADFAGEHAGKVLFEPESLRGDFEESGASRQRFAGSVGEGVKCSSFMAGQGAKAGGIGYKEEVSPTLKSSMSGTNTVPTVVHCMRTDQTGSNGLGICEDTAYTLDGTAGQAVLCLNDQGGQRMDVTMNVTATLRREHGGHIPAVLCAATGQVNAEVLSNIAPTLTCAHEQPYIAGGMVVRCLTPLECERLQGFPDNWTACGHDGKAISDTARYKVLGNSVAIQCVDYVIDGIVEVLTC